MPDAAVPMPITFFPKLPLHHLAHFATLQRVVEVFHQLKRRQKGR